MTGRLTDRMGKLEQHTIIETQWEKARKQQSQCRFPALFSLSVFLYLSFSIVQWCLKQILEANLDVNTNILIYTEESFPHKYPKKGRQQSAVWRKWRAVVQFNITEMEAAGIN